MKQHTFTITFKGRDGQPTVQTDKAPDGTESIAFTVPAQSATASDGYHTFDELYDHRITLYIAMCRNLQGFERHDSSAYLKGGKRVWRSRLHSDGSSFDGWFVLGINRAEGKQITYHLPVSRWSECDFAETLERAPEYDGHSSEDVLERLKAL